MFMYLLFIVENYKMSEENVSIKCLDCELEFFEACIHVLAAICLLFDVTRQKSKELLILMKNVCKG